MPAALPPIQRGEAGMTHQNHLVQRNRARRAKYEPTRKAIEEEELRIAAQRAQEKQERVEAWKTASATITAASSGKSRPLPGGGPRRNRTTVNADGTITGVEAPVSVHQLEKHEQARKDAEYRALYEADMREQIAQRQHTLARMRADEEQQMAALKALNEEAAQKAADENFQRQKENRAYMERMRESNEREMAAQRRRTQEREAKDRALQRLVMENNRHRAEMDERRKKNVTTMLKIQNEESHKAAARRESASRAREADEMAAAIEADRRAVQADREANEAKQRRFRIEFEEAVARDKEHRRTHNYDEPESVTRRRNELSAQSYRLMKQEEALRQAQRRAEYEQDLMNQIIAKQEYAMTHIDGL